MTGILDKLRIRTKILSVLAILSLIAVIVSFQGVRGLGSAEETFSKIVNSEAPATVMLVRSNRFLAMMAYAAYQTVANDGASQEARDAAKAEQQYFEGSITALRNAAELDPSLKDDIASLEADFTSIHEITSRAARLGLRDQTDEAHTILKVADQKIADVTTKLLALNSARIADGKAKAKAAAEAIDTLQLSLITISAVGILGGIAAGLFVSSAGITGPLNRLKETMATLAAGNSNVEVKGTDRGDEVGEMAKTVLVFKENAVAKEAAEKERARIEADQAQLFDVLSDRLARLADGKLNSRIDEPLAPAYDAVKGNFNGAIDALAGLVGSVIEGAANIQTGTEEITRASEDLARRTESSAASLEQTSAAVAEMEGRLKATATAARESVTGSEAAMVAVGAGRSRTDAAVQAMGKVSESAKGIDNVIEGLDKIAFQTRVLAMNAAVEAGRAGDAGRGFAVVADLVSALAMRAEEEAKLARDQLTITQSEIASAVEAVELVNTALADIASTGEQAKALSTQIATDNVAQSSAITEIASVLSSMDAATQQNAAMVEETSAAARTLKSEVETLVGQANTFDLGGPSRATRAVTAHVQTPSLGAQIRKRPERSASAAAPRAELARAKPVPARTEGEWRDF